ncbi:MAG: PAS domain S-box protein [Actinomycetota bacterium]
MAATRKSGAAGSRSGTAGGKRKTKSVSRKTQDRKKPPGGKDSRASERRFRNLLEASPQGIVVVDADGTIVTVNAELERMFGYSRIELIGHPVESLLPKRYHDDHLRHRAEFMTAPRTRPMGVGLELFGLHKNGSEFPVEIGLSAIDTDEGVLATASISDITRRKQAEEKLRDSERRFRDLLEGSPEGILVADAEGTIMIVNARLEEMFGYKREELAGRRIETLLPERFRDTHLGFRSDFMRSPQTRPMGQGRELFGLKKNGEEFPIEIGLSSIETADGVLATASVSDISARKDAEESLRQSEEKFRDLLEGSPEGIVVVDAEGRIVIVNAQVERMFGYERAELVGSKVESLLPERFRKRHAGHRAGYMEAPRTRTMGEDLDLFGLTKSGKEFPVEIGLSSVRTGQGVLATASIIDITKRREAEAAHREAEERFRLLVEGVRDYGIYMLDEDGRVTTWNAGAERLEGYRADEIIGEHVSRVFTPEDIGAGKPEEGLRHAAERGAYETEGWRVRKDGTRFWASVLLTALRDNGSLRGFAQITRDITEKKRSEDALRKLADRLQTLHEIDASILAAVSLDDLFKTALSSLRSVIPSERAAVSLHDLDRKVANYAAAEAEASVGEIRTGEIPLGDIPDLDSILAAPTTIIDLTEVHDRAQAYGLLYNAGLRSLLTAPMHADGKPFGNLTVYSTDAERFDDEHRKIIRELADQLAVAFQQTRLRESLREHSQMLERRVAERTRELREINAELDSFSYSVSHDLRAPLRAMQGLTSALLEDYGDRLDETGKDFAARIVGAARRMDDMIRDLLSYSRLTRADIELSSVDLADVLNDVREQFSGELQDRGGAVHVEEPLPLVRAHRPTLTHVLLNLLTNAVKFVEEGTAPMIEITAERSGPSVTLRVKDNGIGIAPEHQERIFGMLERLHGVDTYEGTGIGLAIVRRGAERMGGRVGVESRAGKGSTFWVELPVAG